MVFGVGKNFLEKDQNVILGSLSGEGLASSQARAETKAERLAKMKSLFADYFSTHPKRQQAGALFNTISSGLGPDRIGEHDLTVSFALKSTPGGHVKVSLVDYVSLLLLQNSKGKFSSPVEQRVLHKYIAKRCSLPQSAIVNQAFKKY